MGCNSQGVSSERVKSPGIAMAQFWGVKVTTMTTTSTATTATVNADCESNQYSFEVPLIGVSEMGA